MIAEGWENDSVRGKVISYIKNCTLNKQYMYKHVMKMFCS